MNPTFDELLPLWQVAAIFAGFQLAALSWRIRREVQIEEDYARVDPWLRQEGHVRRPPATWVTLADGLVGLSLVMLAAVVAVPALGVLSFPFAVRLLGLAVLLFAAYPFVLAGHYNLYNVRRAGDPRSRVTTQEWVTLSIAGIPVAGYVLYWWLG